MALFIHPDCVHKNRVITLVLVEREGETAIGCAKVDSHNCEERLLKI